MPETMQAVVIEAAGGPEQLVLRDDWARPEPKQGEVLIEIRAFGLSRSEWFTREGHSPSVVFPRVLGVECVGVVRDAPGTGLTPGTAVAAMMGGMGRDFDGSYAQLTRVPAAHVWRGLEQVAEAHRAMDAGQHAGKMVVVL